MNRAMVNCSRSEGVARPSPIDTALTDGGFNWPGRGPIIGFDLAPVRARAFWLRERVG
jgi:hypothetical protein